MKVTKCSKTQLPFQALTYLKKAHDKTPNQDSQFWTSFSEGEFYVFYDEDVVGACYIEWPNNVLNIVLLGMDGLKERSRDVFDFFKALMTERNSTHFCIVSRIGWDKIFPEFKNEGTIYTWGSSDIG